jgi:hypothetical protein
MELVSKIRSRNLSIGDHSWTDSRRKTTTTPANPASATAICAAVLRASPGSTRNLTFLFSDCYGSSMSLLKSETTLDRASSDVDFRSKRLMDRATVRDLH